MVGPVEASTFVMVANLWDRAALSAACRRASQSGRRRLITIVSWYSPSQWRLSRSTPSRTEADALVDVRRPGG